MWILAYLYAMFNLLSHLPFGRTVQNKIAELKYDPEGWIFRQHKEKYIYEMNEWTKYYLPTTDAVRNKTVLDVGAGEGETAKFFLDHGAKHVICIEPEQKLVNVLRVNAAKRPVTVLQKKFELTDLLLDYDVLKIDIEGWEEELLSENCPPITKPVIMEIHGLQLIDRFKRKGYRISYPRSDTWIAYGYFNC